MHLTMATDYSLRVLMYLGSHPQGYRGSIPEIASNYVISQNHLIKVVHKLGMLGYLETIRGNGGGIRLALPAEQIGLGKLVRETEENLGVVECLQQHNTCVITPLCRLKPILREATLAFLQVLDNYTLADIIEDTTAFQALFQIERNQ